MNLAHIQPAGGLRGDGGDDVISSLANIGYTAATLYAARSIKRVSNLFSYSSHFQHSARTHDQRPRRILAIPNTPNTRARRRFLRHRRRRVNNIILYTYMYKTIYVYTFPSATHPRRRRLTRENI